MNKILQVGIGYTVANILIKGIGFLTLPVFARLLAPEDFGRYNIFMAYEAILYCCIGIALHTSIRSANLRFNVDDYTSSVSLIYVLQFVLCVVVCYLFSSTLEAWTGFQKKILILLLMSAFGSSLIEFYNNRVAIDYSYKKYFTITATSALVNVALSLILIFFFFSDDRFFGRVLGVGISLFSVGLVVLALLWKNSRPHFSCHFWFFGFNYSLPVVFHGMFQIVLMQAGCLIIQKLVSETAAGMYALALSFFVIVSVLLNSVSTVWSTFFFETMAKKSLEGRRTILHASRTVAIFFLLLTLGLSSIAPELLWILGGSSYNESVFSVYGILICSYLIAIYNIIVVSEYYSNKTHLLLLCTMIGAICCVVLNLIGIRYLGYISVSYTTSIAYFIYVMLHWLICRKLLGFSILSARYVGSTLAISYSVAYVNFCFTNVLWVRLIIAIGVLVATGFFCKYNYAVFMRLMLSRA